MDLTMFARVRSAIAGGLEENNDDTMTSARVGMVVDMSDASFITGFIPVVTEKQKHPYSRPEFLYFSDEEIQLSGDQAVRPVLCPKISSRMPLLAGYAEVINAGKTTTNEDQATARMLNIVQQGSDAEEAKELERARNGMASSDNARKEDDDEELIIAPDNVFSDMDVVPRAEAAFFAILDGHAGNGAAIVASKCLHEHVKTRLSEVLEKILELDQLEAFASQRRSTSSYSVTSTPQERGHHITVDSLVVGALETAFVDMVSSEERNKARVKDDQIAEEKQLWKIPGGCAAIAALVFLGKVYVANAGDCRALLLAGDSVTQLSQDFTPETERKRLQTLAFRQPELIGANFSRLEYSRWLTKKDLKKKVLFRDWYMDGWASKSVRESDLRPPLISDRLRKKRLLNTIGVSRGFGDHHLVTVDDKIPIKPFLTPVPEVRVYDIRKQDTLTDRDVLILASDGLWDVLSNEDAALIVKSALSNTDTSDESRYTMAAQELAVAARGLPTDGRWLLACGGGASTDDITVFVIPLKFAIAPPSKEEDEDDDELISLDS